MIDLPTLSAQKNIYPLVSVSNPYGCNLPYSQAKGGLLVPFALVTVSALAKKQDCAHVALTHPISILKIVNQGTFAGRP
jgi:hypothetical protein